MERTLEQTKELLHIQYVLECLSEYYQVAKKESDKYYIKCQLLDFIDDFGLSISFLKDYMKLQPEKFEPFIKTLEGIKNRRVTKKKEQTFTSEPKEVKMVVYRG